MARRSKRNVAIVATGQTDHRAYVMDPWGMLLAASEGPNKERVVVLTTAAPVAAGSPIS